MLYTPENRRELAEIKDGFCHVDETKLDMFAYHPDIIPDWQPNEERSNIKSFGELTIFSLDTETTGGIKPQYFNGKPRWGSDRIYRNIDADNHRITLVGVKLQNGRSCIIDALADERKALISFFKLIDKYQPDILTTYNGFSFDIPFIIRRCEVLGVKHPFWIQRDSMGNCMEKTRAVAQINSKPVTYNPIWLTIKTANGKKHCAIVDLFHEVLAWDSVKRKLTSYRLKEAPVQMGLVDESGVIDQPFEEMLKCYKRWNDGGKEEMVEYLESDLNLTMILGNYLLPSIYYQQYFLDWKLQSLASSGNGSKWDSIISQEYPEEYQPETSPKLRFKGAYTLAIAGIYGGGDKEVCKVDVASLYPTVMLLYGISSIKDIKMVQLMILKYQRNQRFILKKLAEVDKEADQLQGVMKILLNSGYGSLAATGIKFNDYIAAALVTAYARGVFRLMLERAKEYGAEIVSCDTDAVIVSVQKGKSRELCDFIQAGLPGQDTEFSVTLDLEWVAKAVYIPPSDNTEMDTTLVDNDDGLLIPGLKKNYIIIMNEKSKIDKKTGVKTIIYQDGAVKYNGKYRKRDRTKLEKEIQPKLIELYANGGELAARQFYRDTRKQLVNKEYPLSKLSITRKIRVGEKNLVSIGVGDEGDVVEIWKGIDKVNPPVFNEKTKRMNKAKDTVIWVKDATPDDIDWDFYIKKLEDNFFSVARFF